MADPTARQQRTATVFGTLVVLYAATFVVGGLLHLGVEIPVGFGVLAEPVILPATIVESLCGLGLAISGYGLLIRKPRGLGKRPWARTRSRWRESCSAWSPPPWAVVGPP